MTTKTKQTAKTAAKTEATTKADAKKMSQIDAALAVLAKVERGQFSVADERTKRAICGEITRRTKKVEANVGRIESQIDAVRAKIDRATENLAMANSEDIPGISKLLAGPGNAAQGQAASGLRRPSAVPGSAGGYRAVG